MPFFGTHENAKCCRVILNNMSLDDANDTIQWQATSMNNVLFCVLFKIV